MTILDSLARGALYNHFPVIMCKSTPSMVLSCYLNVGQAYLSVRMLERAWTIKTLDDATWFSVDIFYSFQVHLKITLRVGLQPCKLWHQIEVSELMLKYWCFSLNYEFFNNMGWRGLSAWSRWWMHSLHFGGVSNSWSEEDVIEPKLVLNCTKKN